VDYFKEWAEGDPDYTAEEQYGEDFRK